MTHIVCPIAYIQCFTVPTQENISDGMSGSPAWLTIALTTLASETTTTNPSQLLNTGIRSLPSSHILHHLNRWARHVWRPAVNPSTLSSLTRSDFNEEKLNALGIGACSLLAALLEAIARCEAPAWLDVLAVLFLADDPWTVEVGRLAKPTDVDRATNIMRQLYEKREIVAKVSAALSKDGVELPPVEMELPPSTESFAELRCRVAALQLQLDDVTAVVRRNESNTKNLVSSFHFWSLLLLEEIRACKQQVAGNSEQLQQQGRIRTKRSMNGSSSDSGRNREIVSQVRPVYVKPETTRTVRTTLIGNGSQELGALRKEDNAQKNNVVNDGIASTLLRKKSDNGKKRIFRDGKWINL